MTHINPHVQLALALSLALLAAPVRPAVELATKENTDFTLQDPFSTYGGPNRPNNKVDSSGRSEPERQFDRVAQRTAAAEDDACVPAKPEL